MTSYTTGIVGKPFNPQSEIKDMVNMEAKSKWQCPKCGVGIGIDSMHNFKDLRGGGLLSRNAIASVSKLCTPMVQACQTSFTTNV